jgi:DNA-binding beta-propeller fold protein YncE
LGHTDQNGNPIWTAGGQNNGPSAQGLISDTDTVLDPIDHRLFVADQGNNRVLVFNLDSTNSIASTTAAYVLGQPDFISNAAATTQNGMSVPYGLAYDPATGRLFVADDGNARVLVFDASTSTIRDGENAENVLGQSDFVTNSAATTQSGMTQPHGLAYDPATSRLFVADDGPNRVLVFDASTSTLAATPEGEPAENVLGQTDFTSNNTTTPTQSAFADVWGLTYDPTTSRLFVPDQGDNRVLVFDAGSSTIMDGEDAEAVLGQTDFTSTGFATTQSSLSSPFGSAYDPTTGRLFISDSGNARVLVFDAATSTITNGENAENVLGQSDFVSGVAMTTQSGIAGPQGLAYDPATSRLFVADSFNNRVLVFDAATSTITDGVDASALLGHYDLNGNPIWTAGGQNNGPSAQGLISDTDTVLDPIDHRLFVADQGNNRVLVFNLDSTNSIASTTAAYVLGQPDFISNAAATTQNGMSVPYGLAYAAATGRLFVTDQQNNRVLVFDAATSTLAATPAGEDAEAVLGQSDFVSNSTTTPTQSSIPRPQGLAYDPATSRLFVADGIGHSNTGRVLVFDLSSGITDGMPAAYVLGQSDFVSNSTTTPTQSAISTPKGLAYNPATSRLFVADTPNNRVLVFDAATSTITNGENAENVLGQSDFVSNSTSSPTQSSIPGPQGLAYDPATSRLFVADGIGPPGERTGNRVLVFDVSTSTIQNGEHAENVLGQSDFVSNSTSSPTQSSIPVPNGLAYDPATSHLFVADTLNNRVMQFSFITITTDSLPDGTVGSSYSQTINTTSSQGTVSFSLSSGSLPSGLSLDASTGVISGTPTTAGTYPFTVIADDHLSTGIFFDTKDYTITIAAASGGGGGGGGGSVGVGGGGSSYSISVDGGAPSTATTNVTLSFYATGAYTMEIANTPDFASSSWEPYATTYPWMLTSGVGTKTVYARFRSIAGTDLGTVNASIQLIPGTGTSSAPLALQSEIAALQAEIRSLIAQLNQKNGTGASTSSYHFTRNLSLWNPGPDVTALQTYLVNQNTGPAARALAANGTTTTFGLLTYAALKEFQKSVGIPATGYFGPITRAYVNGHS